MAEDFYRWNGAYVNQEYKAPNVKETLKPVFDWVSKKLEGQVEQVIGQQTEEAMSSALDRWDQGGRGIPLQK